MKKFYFILFLVIVMLPATLTSAASATTKQTTYFTGTVLIHHEVYIKADYIQWFRGEQANKEAAKDHSSKCMWTGGKCYVTDDYYIRNANKRIRTLKIAKNAAITMVTYQIEKNINPKAQKLSLTAFLTEMKKDRYRSTPFHIEVKNGSIVKITEQYIP